MRDQCGISVQFEDLHRIWEMMLTVQFEKNEQLIGVCIHLSAMI